MRAREPVRASARRSAPFQQLGEAHACVSETSLLTKGTKPVEYSRVCCLSDSCRVMVEFTFCPVVLFPALRVV